MNKPTALMAFKTIEGYEKYLRKNGTSLDSVSIGGVVYTMEEYDEDGKNIVYANRRTNTNFQIENENRYKFGFGDSVLSAIYPASSYRNDISYLD
jgi:hypothetical protein